MKSRGMPPRAGISAMTIAVIAVLSLLPGVSRAGSTPLAHATFDGASGTWHIAKNLVPDAGDAAPLLPGPLDTGWLFSPNKRTHPDSAYQHFRPDIDVSPSGIVGVVWAGDSPSGTHIFYSRSTDGAATWSAPEQVDTRAGGTGCGNPDLDFTPSNVPVVVWEDDRLGYMNVYVAQRDPLIPPTPWINNIQVNTAGSTPGTYPMNPSLAVKDEYQWFVAWTDFREGIYYQVYVRATRNFGVTWSTEARVSDEIGDRPLAGNPCIIVDPAPSTFGAEKLYCVMDDWRGPGSTRYPNAYFSKSTNGGASWSTGVMVNDIEPGFQQVSSQSIVKLADGALTVGWLNWATGPNEFRTSVSTDAGVTWGASAAANPTPSAGVGTWSSITSSGSWVFAGFDYWGGTSMDAYFRASADGGRSWTEPAYRMDDQGIPGAPVENTVIAASDPTTVYAAWEDTRAYPGPWATAPCRL